MKLSIVVPVYNTRDYLAACLDSVLYPELGDYEVIVVNDGSTDDSGEIARNYVERYPDLFRLITTLNGGLGAARNVGIEQAKGDWLLFLDSDDRLSHGAVPEILDTLKPERDIILFDLLSVNPDGSVIEQMHGCKKSGLVSLASYPELLLNYPSGCNKICKRALFLDSGIRFPGRVWYEDLRTMPKLYLLTDRIWASDQAWYLYLMRPGSITNSAAVGRNLEIIDAVDDLLSFYRDKGFYKKYKAQLDYVAFYNMFLTGSVRVCLADPKSDVLPKLRDAFLHRFPDYAENPYVKQMPSRHRVLTKLLLSGHGSAVAALMHLNDRIKKKSR